MENQIHAGEGAGDYYEVVAVETKYQSSSGGCLTFMVDPLDGDEHEPCRQSNI